MATQITVTLQDDTFRRAAYLAELTGRDVADVLAETIDLSLDPHGVPAAPSPPLETLSDAEVLELAASGMEPAQDGRLRALLDRQQAGRLEADERASMLALLQVYQDGLLRKAQALRVAVQRGLLPPSPSGVYRRA